MTDITTEAMTAEDLLQDDSLFLLRKMCVEFFQLTSAGKVYPRRPPIAVRLPYNDFIFVVKPCTRRRGKEVTVDDRGILIEVLRRQYDSKIGPVSRKGIKIVIEGEARFSSRWKDEGKNIEEVRALVELAEQFHLDPLTVMRRNADRCCCCGKVLIDEVSRCRGIGPECLKHVSAMSWAVSQTEETISKKKELKRKMRECHPDLGGDPEEFKRWSALYHAI
jgi:hypothetical protein